MSLIHEINGQLNVCMYHIAFYFDEPGKCNPELSPGFISIDTQKQAIE